MLNEQREEKGPSPCRAFLCKYAFGATLQSNVGPSWRKEAVQGVPVHGAAVASVALPVTVASARMACGWSLMYDFQNQTTARRPKQAPAEHGASLKRSHLSTELNPHKSCGKKWVTHTEPMSPRAQMVIISESAASGAMHLSPVRGMPKR